MGVPHKHAAIIKAWADGADIEKQDRDGTWVDMHRSWPWYEDWVYRIKPEPKPDMVFFGTLDKPERGRNSLNSCFTRQRYVGDKVKLTFDGETGELKTAEVIK